MSPGGNVQGVSTDEGGDHLTFGGENRARLLSLIHMNTIILHNLIITSRIAQFSPLYFLQYWSLVIDSILQYMVI